MRVPTCIHTARYKSIQQSAWSSKKKEKKACFTHRPGAASCPPLDHPVPRGGWGDRVPDWVTSPGLHFCWREVRGPICFLIPWPSVVSSPCSRFKERRCEISCEDIIFACSLMCVESRAAVAAVFILLLVPWRFRSTWSLLVVCCLGFWCGKCCFRVPLRSLGAWLFFLCLCDS